MREISQIQKDVEDITQKIAIVTTKIAEKTTELETLKQRNAAIVERTIGNKKRQSKSLEIQRRNIFTVTQQIDELQYAKERFDGKLSDLEQELRYAEIFQQVESYKEAEKVFFEKINRINSSLAAIDSSIATLQNQIDELRSTGCPLHLLATILKDLNGRVSVHHFFEGNVETPTPVEDEDLISSLFQKYKTVGQGVPAVGDLNNSGQDYLSQLFYVSTQASNLRQALR